MRAVSAAVISLKHQKVFIAGHRGMVGSAILRKLHERGCENIVVRRRDELDLRDQSAVFDFFASERPEVVFFAAAKVGGILANSTYPGEFIYENIAIATHCIHGAFLAGCQRFLFLGSTCIYPKLAEQPMAESCLMTGQLAPSNEAYAIAKIAGLKMCQFYRKQYGVTFHSAMPTNLYGPGDNYHPENSHVLPALIRKFHIAKTEGHDSVEIWGTGQPRREFLHVDDMANAVIHLVGLENPPNLVNVGTGVDVTITELAELVAKIVGFEGKLEFDTSKPDGPPVKRTDIRLIQETGWKPEIELEDGIRQTYQTYLQETETNLVREK